MKLFNIVHEIINNYAKHVKDLITQHYIFSFHLAIIILNFEINTTSFDIML
jgi:hypothetical protein